MPRQIFVFDRPSRFVAGTVGEPGDRTFFLQATDQTSGADTAALELPIDEEFRVSAMGLAWDHQDGVVVIEAQAPVEDAEVAEQTLLEDSEEGPDALRVRIEPAHARAFVERARLMISAGRPPCPLRGQPLDSSGHVCPRQNGYHRPSTIE